MIPPEEYAKIVRLLQREARSIQRIPDGVTLVKDAHKRGALDALDNIVIGLAPILGMSRDGFKQRVGISWTTIHPGSLLDAERLAQVIAEHGDAHAPTCRLCGGTFFSPELKAKTCWGCWYQDYMDHAEEAYADVFTILRDNGYEVGMDQTGGMNLAIHVTVSDTHYLWLTDHMGDLSLKREPDDGWTLGLYSTLDEDDCQAIPMEGADYLSDPVKNADTALALVQRGM